MLLALLLDKNTGCIDNEKCYSNENQAEVNHIEHMTVKGTCDPLDFDQSQNVSNFIVWGLV